MQIDDVAVNYCMMQNFERRKFGKTVYTKKWWIIIW